MDEKTLVTGAQIRMARGLLKWSVVQLAEEAGVSTTTIKKLEKEHGLSVAVRISHNHAVRDALLKSARLRFEENACIFIAEKT